MKKTTGLLLCLLLALLLAACQPAPDGALTIDPGQSQQNNALPANAQPETAAPTGKTEING